MIDFSKVKDFKVLVVGDGITDEYRYVKPLGKAIKNNILSTKSVGKRETFHGGVWAAAEHIKTFCAQVDVLTGSSVMRNVSFVEETYTRKLFSVHELRENVEQPRAYDIRDYDVVIITDFGHGAMTRDLIAKVSKEARYLAVNAQTNTSNFGFNLITKYARVDFAVLDELEARLAGQEQDAPIEDVILKLGLRNVIVTMGAKGAIGFDGAFERQLALTENAIDTMGAGDAFLCVTAPFAAAGAPMRDLLRIGNAAGAAKVGIIGHRQAVTRQMLEGALSGR